MYGGTRAGTVARSEGAPNRTRPRLRGRAFGARVVCGAVVVSVLAACGSSPPASEAGGATSTAGESAYESQRLAAVEPVLEAWGAALRDDDETTLRSLIDPHAAPGFEKAQIRLARDLQGADFDEFEFGLGDGPDVFVPQDIADRLGAIDEWGAPVQLNFRLAGVDDATVRSPVGVILARRPDGWKLVSTHELQDGTHATWPAGPWDFGPVTQTRVPVDGAGGSLVLAHPGHGAGVDAVERMLPEAVGEVSDFWGADWDRTVVVEIADSSEEFSKLTGNPSKRSDIAAASISFDSDVAGHGQRVVFAPGALTAMSAGDARLVLQHELSHVAVRTDVGRGAPTWLLEGTADYVAELGADSGADAAGAPVPLVAAMVDAHGPPGALPKNSDFAGPNASLAYELARSVADYIVDEYGEDGLRAVHRALGGGGLDDAAKDEALRGAIGVGMGRFTSGWSAWLGDRFG